MPWGTTSWLCLDVNVERWFEFPRGHRSAQAKHHSSAEGHLEELQLDNPLTIAREVAVLRSAWIRTTIIIFTRRKFELNHNSASGIDVSLQLDVGIPLPLECPGARLCPNDFAKLFEANRA